MFLLAAYIHKLKVPYGHRFTFTEHLNVIYNINKFKVNQLAKTK